MSITMEDVRAALDPEEVNYDDAALLGAEALPFLNELARGDDTMLASKAIYLASLIGGADSLSILAAAVGEAEPAIRVAAASGLQNLGEQAEPHLAALLKDPDVGVRKVALQSVAAIGSPAMQAHLDRIAETDSEPLLRQLASSLSK